MAKIFSKFYEFGTKHENLSVKLLATIAEPHPLQLPKCIGCSLAPSNIPHIEGSQHFVKKLSAKYIMGQFEKILAFENFLL